MENATKALLMAAGVLFAVMILSLLLIGYNQLSDYYAEKSESTEVKQIAEFNSKFENYNRKKVRGSDLISLVNRVIDYNAQETVDWKKYRKIELTINLGDNLDEFRFITNKNKNNYGDAKKYETILSSNIITNKNGSDTQLVTLTSTLNNKINTNSGLNVTDAIMQKFAGSISNIVLEKNVINNANKYTQGTLSNFNSYASDYQKVQSKKSLIINTLNWPTNNTTYYDNNVLTIEQLTCQYYEYLQFKRAYFDCTAMNYDDEKGTGRICEIVFTVRAKNGSVEFDS